MKEHSLRHQEENKPPGRTLFVLNVPPYITEDNLKHLFSHGGKILTVILQNTTNLDQNGFKTAYIVFAKREGLLKSLTINSLSLDKVPLITGLEKWIEDYNNSIGNSAMLSKEINNFMLNYDKTEKHSKKQIKEVDDEGWTVVTKRSRNPGIAHKESVKIKLNNKILHSSKKKELNNFYTFQIKESKQKNLAKLRKNYEDAKKKVNLMKNSRRFKPY